MAGGGGGAAMTMRRAYAGSAAFTAEGSIVAAAVAGVALVCSLRWRFFSLWRRSASLTCLRRRPAQSSMSSEGPSASPHRSVLTVRFRLGWGCDVVQLEGLSIAVS